MWPHVVIATAGSEKVVGLWVLWDAVVARGSRQIVQMEGHSSPAVMGRIAESRVHVAQVSVGRVMVAEALILRLKYKRVLIFIICSW
jgi:hypothetical protein